MPEIVTVWLIKGLVGVAVGERAQPEKKRELHIPRTIAIRIRFLRPLAGCWDSDLVVWAK
jgi:hypothetical protein